MLPEQMIMRCPPDRGCARLEGIMRLHVGVWPEIMLAVNSAIESLQHPENADGNAQN